MGNARASSLGFASCPTTPRTCSETPKPTRLVLRMESQCFLEQIWWSLRMFLWSKFIHLWPLPWPFGSMCSLGDPSHNQTSFPRLDCLMRPARIEEEAPCHIWEGLSLTFKKWSRLPGFDSESSYFIHWKIYIGHHWAILGPWTKWGTKTLFALLLFPPNEVAGGTDFIQKVVDGFGVPTIKTKIMVDMNAYDGFAALASIEDMVNYVRAHAGL